MWSIFILVTLKTRRTDISRKPSKKNGNVRLLFIVNYVAANEIFYYCHRNFSDVFTVLHSVACFISIFCSFHFVAVLFLSCSLSSSHHLSFLHLLRWVLVHVFGKLKTKKSLKLQLKISLLTPLSPQTTRNTEHHRICVQVFRSFAIKHVRRVGIFIVNFDANSFLVNYFRTQNHISLLKNENLSALARAFTIKIHEYFQTLISLHPF